jgi:hypothetical protein
MRIVAASFGGNPTGRVKDARELVEVRHSLALSPLLSVWAGLVIPCRFGSRRESTLHRAGS